jgi:hypothetical protein
MSIMEVLFACGRGCGVFFLKLLPQPFNLQFSCSGVCVWVCKVKGWGSNLGFRVENVVGRDREKL